MTIFSFPIRVYYEDTDLGEIVYYANYLKFTERGRTEMLRALGVDQLALKRETGIVFVVRNVKADYLATAHFDDELVVKTSVKEIKNASFVLTQDIYRGDQKLFASEVVLVAIDVKRKRAVPMPAELRALLVD